VGWTSKDLEFDSQHEQDISVFFILIRRILLWGGGGLIRMVVKQQARESNNSLSSGANVKNDRAILPLLLLGVVCN
jgi:hypothetical protein